MDIFGPTIRTRWDKQIKNLKDELTNQFVGLFSNETFNRATVLNKAAKEMNIVHDQYRIHLEIKPRYELPLMIPSREWKALVEDGHERALRKQGNLQLGTRRYAILSTL